MTYANLQNYLSGRPGSDPATSVVNRGGSTSSPHSGESPDVPSEPSSVWDSGMKSAFDANNRSPQLGSLTPSANPNNLFDQTGLGQFSTGASILSGRTQPIQSSSGNTMQVPIRSSTPGHPSPPPGFPWSNTGAVVGADLDRQSAQPPHTQPPTNTTSNLPGSSSQRLDLKSWISGPTFPTIGATA
ncbi:uncharacterized protein LY89DRAFT_683262, partial [Mollisia scopiformis]